MKKIISMGVILIMSLALLTGCGGPDLTGVTEKYNQVADIFNEAAALFNSNGWNNDEEYLEMHNDLADAIEEIRIIIEDPEQAKNIDTEQMEEDLDTLIASVKEYKEAVAIAPVVENILDLAALTDKYNEIADLHTKVVAQAQQNGWEQDADVVATLNEVATTMEMPKTLLEDPTIIEGEDLTQADIDEFTAALGGFIEPLNQLDEITATAYTGAAE